MKEPEIVRGCWIVVENWGPVVHHGMPAVCLGVSPGEITGRPGTHESVSFRYQARRTVDDVEIWVQNGCLKCKCKFLRPADNQSLAVLEKTGPYGLGEV